jgi:hypothetical protein
MNSQILQDRDFKLFIITKKTTSTIKKSENNPWKIDKTINIIDNIQFLIKALFLKIE